MWTEKMRYDWQHTSTLIAYQVEMNKSKKGKTASPDDYNPMENGQDSIDQGIKLNSPEAFAALSKVASLRPNR